MRGRVHAIVVIVLSFLLTFSVKSIIIQMF